MCVWYEENGYGVCVMCGIGGLWCVCVCVFDVVVSVCGI